MILNLSNSKFVFVFEFEFEKAKMSLKFVTELELKFVINDMDEIEQKILDTNAGKQLS